MDVRRGRVIEDLGIALHLRRAQRMIAARDVRRLDPVRRANRQLLLHELDRYRRAGRFPRNTDFPRRAVPVFRDELGTHCAVAHLLAITGHRDLVDRVAQGGVFSRVHELAGSRELLAWLDAAGLTLEEAALIQPAYCYLTVADQCFCQPNTFLLPASGTIASLEGEEQGTVVIEQVPANEIGVTAGMTVSAGLVRGLPGETILLAVRRDGAAADGLEFWQIGLDLEVSPDTVTCNEDDFTSSHPVPMAVALDALAARQEQCVAALEAVDPRWGAHPEGCDDGCGCRTVGAPAAVVPALSSLALLGTLLIRRRFLLRRGLGKRAGARSP